MADDLKIEINDAGALALVQSQEVQTELARRAASIQAAASASGGTYEVKVTVEPWGATGQARAQVHIVTADHDARVAEATTRALSSALDAGRG